MVDLRANPFFLDDEGVAWVKNTIAGMTLEEKNRTAVFLTWVLPVRKAI